MIENVEKKESGGGYFAPEVFLGIMYDVIGLGRSA
jgi:hypothetical protein